MTTTRNKLILLALQNTPLILFVLIFLFFGIASPRFFQFKTFENIFTQASYIGIVASGMTFVLLTGGIDISVGSNMYLSAVAAGLLIQELNAPVWLALLVCLCVGALFGATNAFLITKLRLIPFVATLGTLVAGRGLALLLNRSKGLPFPDSVTRLGATRVFDFIPVPILIFAGVVLVAYVILHLVPLGRQIYAVGNDVEAAKKAGINTGRVLASVYIICGILAALGGFVSVAQLGIVNSGFGEGYEFEAIAAAVLGGASLFGGIGSIFPGTVIGTVMFQMVQAGLVFTQVDIYLQPLVKAGIIFFAVLLDSLRTMWIKRMERRNIRTEVIDRPRTIIPATALPGKSGMKR